MFGVMYILYVYIYLGVTSTKPVASSLLPSGSPHLALSSINILYSYIFPSVSSPSAANVMLPLWNTLLQSSCLVATRRRVWQINPRCDCVCVCA